MLSRRNDPKLPTSEFADWDKRWQREPRPVDGQGAVHRFRPDWHPRGVIAALALALATPVAVHAQTLSLDNVSPIALTASSTQSALSLDPASGNVVLRSSTGDYNQCLAPPSNAEPSADKLLLAGNTQLAINNSGAIGLATANPVSYLNRSVADGRRVLSMRLAQPLLCADFAPAPVGGSNPVAVQFVDPNGDSSGLLYGGIGSTNYLTNGAAPSRLLISADSRLACCVMLPAANANCFQGLVGGTSASASASGPGGIRGSFADLAVAVVALIPTPPPSGTYVYTITVSNVGGASVSGVRVRDWFPKASGGFAVTLSSGTWTCSASGGASCGVASGSGNLALDAVSLNPGGSVNIEVTRTLNAAAAGTPFSVSAAVFAPPSANETALANNQSAVTSTVQQTGVTLAINDVTQTERSGGGTTNFQFTITRSSTASAVSVQVGTANGSALAGSDYTAISGQTVNFTAGGAATAVVNVSVNADAIAESNETFTVNLTNPVGAAIADAQGVGTINNDDTATIAINDVNVVEGDSGTTNAVFTVTLAGTVQGGFSVQASTAPVTATAGVDYTTTSAMLTFDGINGEIETLTVPVNGDVQIEADEFFVVNLGVPSSGLVFVSDGSGVGTIINDD